MALEWNKEISFAGLKKGTSKTNSDYPSKTYMNLTVQKKRETNLRSALPKLIILVVVIGLFVKFGIIDFYGRVNDAESRLSQQESILTQLNLELMDYDEVLEEYESYDTEHLATSADAVSAMDALGLVDRLVVPNATVESLGLSGNVLTLNVSEITLDSTGALVSLLYTDPMVKNVTVSTASTQERNAEGVTTAMTVTLQKVEE